MIYGIPVPLAVTETLKKEIVSLTEVLLSRNVNLTNVQTVAAGWNAVSGPNNGTCLKRCTQWTTLYSPESVAALLTQSGDFGTLALSIEGGPHAAVHDQLGGKCGDFSSMVLFDCTLKLTLLGFM